MTDTGRREWRKSTRSTFNGNCVEVAGDWHKSTRSNFNGACVELRRPARGVVLVRDSKNPAAGTLAIPAAAWQALTGRIKAGDLTL